jgi:hypothetical protein
MPERYSGFSSRITLGPGTHSPTEEERKKIRQRAEDTFVFQLEEDVLAELREKYGKELVDATKTALETSFSNEEGQNEAEVWEKFGAQLGDWCSKNVTRENAVESGLLIRDLIEQVAELVANDKRVESVLSISET